MNKLHLPAGCNSASGFTLIESMVAIAILVILFSAITSIMQQVWENIGSSRVKATALTVAQQKMETIRNLPYNSIGTIGGIPQGVLAATETVNLNSQDFFVKTSVAYIDDPFDGVAPGDVVNTDYKRARVEVTWGGAYPSITPLSFVTNIAPKNSETQVPGGTLTVKVHDSFGLPVNSATVKIDNTAVSPAIHLDSLTGSDGILALPGAPPCNSCYRITVSKPPNYSQDRSYSSAEVANPSQSDATVIDGELTQTSFSIDKVANISLTAYNQNLTPASNVQFTLRGAKIIGFDTADEPVYKFQKTTSTIGNVVSIPNLEWDNYLVDLSSSAYNLAGSNPITPFSLNPNSHQDIRIVVAPKTSASLLVTVTDPLNIPLASAEAVLKSESGAYEQNRFTSATGSANFGQAFFNSLTGGIYNLDINLPGYVSASASVTIAGNQRENIILAPAF